MRKFSIGLLTAFVLILPVVAMAQIQNGLSGQPTQIQNGLGGPQQTVSSGQPVTVDNPLKVGSFCGLIKALLQGVIEIGIPIAVLFIVYAGFKFVFARGNSEKLVEARRNLMYTLIGIGIFLGAWLLAQVIANTVNAVAGSNNSLVSCK